MKSVIRRFLIMQKIIIPMDIILVVKCVVGIVVLRGYLNDLWNL